MLMWEEVYEERYKKAFDVCVELNEKAQPTYVILIALTSILTLAC